jgi:transcriptional regulator with XRE-family HTH domain
MTDTTEVVATAHRRKLNRVGGSSSASVIVPGPKGIGERLTMRRLQLQMTQSEVAQRVRYTPKTGRKRNIEKPLSRNAYAMYESSKAEPNLGVVEEIAQALNISAGWLAFGEEVQAPATITRSAAPQLDNDRLATIVRIDVRLSGVTGPVETAP